MPAADGTARNRERSAARENIAGRAVRAVRARSGIDQLAVVGDGRSIALIAQDGGVEWLCWPRFDSDALVARVL